MYMKNSVKQVSQIVKSMPQSAFKNSHGEPFVIYSNGNSVFMSGTEVDMMVDEESKMDGILPLFNASFNIWAVDELYKLGEALKDVAVKNGYTPEKE
jgi:hypothetical protein